MSTRGFTMLFMLLLCMFGNFQNIKFVYVCVCITSIPWKSHCFTFILFLRCFNMLFLLLMKIITPLRSPPPLEAHWCWQKPWLVSHSLHSGLVIVHCTDDVQNFHPTGDRDKQQTCSLAPRARLTSFPCFPSQYWLPALILAHTCPLCVNAQYLVCPTQTLRTQELEVKAIPPTELSSSS